jgi:peptidyl-prolyl cis-trans isomerase D
MMRDLREKTKWVMIIVALAFVGLMVFEWGMDMSGQSAGIQTGDIGRVNNTPISFQQYQETYAELLQRAQQQAGQATLTREQIRQVEEATWDQLVTEVLLQQEIRRRGIRVSAAEIRQAARTSPHPELAQNELFMTDGRFDIEKYQQFLSSPAASDDLLLQLEHYYRQQIPRAKLLRQVMAGAFIPDAELWRSFRDRMETAVVDYVNLDLSTLVPGEVEVTEREIRDHYRRHREDFRRAAVARMDVAWLSKAPTAADSAAALERAREARAEIVGGASFGEVAARVSDDPGTRERGGELGSFERGQMVPEFEEAAFSAPVGSVTEPVLSPFGYHLIEVTARTDGEVTARHILISLARGEESLDRLYARADSLELAAPARGVEAAARQLGAQYAAGVDVSGATAFLPGIGDASEVLEWAAEELEEEGRVAGTVSPLFETDQAFYIARVESFGAGGEIPLEEATPQIRALLELEKRRERARAIGREMRAEVRGGRSLEEVAAARGLRVERTPAFSRIDPNPAFGQANAATGAAFGTPIGQVSDVVETTAGLFLIRPAEREEASRELWDSQKTQQRLMEQNQVRTAYFQRWMEHLRESARIVDRRSEVFDRRS